MAISKQTPIYFTLLITSIISIWLFHFMAFQTDTPSFVNAVKLLLEEPAEPDRLYRLSKPLALIIPAFLYSLFNIPISYSFFLQQLIAYWLSALFIYKILSELLGQKDLAYLGMLAYILCQPVAVYGLAMLTDGLGWCWAIIGIWLSLLIFNNNTPKTTELLGLGIFLGLGFFIKENIAATGIFIFYYILINKDYSWQQKVIFYLNIGISFILTFALGSYLVYLLWGESLFQWIEFGKSDPPPFQLKSFILQSYHTLDVFWVFVALGIQSYFVSKQKNSLLSAILLTACSIWILLPLFWPYLYDRILFLTAPFMLVWIVLGAQRFGEFALPLVIIGGSMNLLTTFGIYKYQISGLLMGSAAIFTILLLISFRYNKPLRH